MTELSYSRIVWPPKERLDIRLVICVCMQVSKKWEFLEETDRESEGKRDTGGSMLQYLLFLFYDVAERR